MQEILINCVFTDGGASAAGGGGAAGAGRGKRVFEQKRYYKGIMGTCRPTCFNGDKS